MLVVVYCFILLVALQLFSRGDTLPALEMCCLVILALFAVEFLIRIGAGAAAWLKHWHQIASWVVVVGSITLGIYGRVECGDWSLLRARRTARRARACSPSRSRCRRCG